MSRRTTHTARPVGRMETAAAERRPAVVRTKAFVANGGAAEDWRHRAACRDQDPELFFPIGNTGPALLQIEDAKDICRRCDVVASCLQWSIESGQDAGVSGGMSEDERRAFKRRAARARAKAAGLSVPDDDEPEPEPRPGRNRQRDDLGHFASVLDSAAESSDGGE